MILKEGITDLKKTWKKLRGKDKDASAGEPHKPKMSFRLPSLLVYTVGVKCHGINPDVEYAPEHIFSLSENAVNRLLKASMKDLVTHNHTHLVRIYPKGTRVNSTNYQPHRYWAAGCQVAAINWQTFGEAIWLDGMAALLMFFCLLQTLGIALIRPCSSGMATVDMSSSPRPCAAPKRISYLNELNTSSMLRYATHAPRWQ